MIRRRQSGSVSRAKRPIDALADEQNEATGENAPAGLTAAGADSIKRYAPWISAIGSVVGACIIASGAYWAASVFQPNFVRLENAVFNMHHLVEILDTPSGCDVIMANSAAVVTDDEQRFTHSLDFAGCQSLRRAVEPHTVSGIGRVTEEEIIISNMAQSLLFSTTSVCPDGTAGPIPGLPDLSEAQIVSWCELSVGFGQRLLEGPPWPESWKASGLVMLSTGASCSDDMLLHSRYGDYVGLLFWTACYRRTPSWALLQLTPWGRGPIADPMYSRQHPVDPGHSGSPRFAAHPVPGFAFLQSAFRAYNDCSSMPGTR